jgi:glucokinase
MEIRRSGTANYLKFQNKKKVLQRIIESPELLCRADLAKQLKLSKPTVSSLVDELVLEGWIIERESQTSKSVGGRRPIHLFFNKEVKKVIGVDIGGTSTEIAVMNLSGDIIKNSSLNTQLSLQDDLVQQICSEIKRLLSEAYIDDADVLSLAVGAPGITDIEKGVVMEAPSLKWRDYPLKAELESYFSFPVYIENDVNVAVLGELWSGNAKDMSNIVLITLGTGVGCGIVLNGELYRGGHYAAGEIGYMITDKEMAKKGYDSTFEGYGFLENYVGGPSVVEQMLKRVKSGSQYEECKELTAKKVFELAMAGDTHARMVVDEAVDHIAIAMINIVSLLNPECVVLGGGLSKSGDWFLPIIKEQLQRHLPKQCQTEIYITKLPQGSLLGAAALCLKNDELLSW